MDDFYAKIDTINETTYDTNTLSVIDEAGLRRTLRIDENAAVREGEVYHFTVEPIVFKDREQWLVTAYVPLVEQAQDDGERDRLMDVFYTFAPASTEQLKRSIETYLAHMSDGPIRQIVEAIYQRHHQAFYLYPAATRFHHAYIGGLAHHTETMLRLAEGLLAVYAFLDRDLLIGGVLLHDMCKVLELSDFKNPEYTREGRLIGHITMGVKEVAKTAETLGLYDTEERLLLEHMVLSHHYYGNFGSPKKPNVPEALALHFIDNIDSKFAVLGEALAETEPGTFTQSLPVIDRERFYKALRKK
ncbi:MAG: HD domain-containing protein [Acholeplasmatales bacterium]|nr:MAG: HD domain-containing protein [Acholeplasmatales bacterium]